MSSYKLGFIGAGAMAEAIINGVLTANLHLPQDLIVSDINQERLKFINNKFAIATTCDNILVFQQAEVIILAVKPQHLKEALGGFPRDICNKTIISIAAGISTNFIEELVGKVPVIRVMPNNPSLVGAGMAALCKGKYADDQDLQLAKEIFASIGETVILAEYLMDAVTGLSGSGPAFVYQFIEALADGGVQVGLPRNIAYKLAAQTVVGAGLMVLKTGLHPGQLKDMVTSPGGTTIRGINVLEKAGFRGTVMDAVESAYLMSKKLGSE